MKRILLASSALTLFAAAVPAYAESGLGLVTTETVDRGNFHPAPLNDIESAQASFKLASITLTGAGAPASPISAFVPISAVQMTQEFWASLAPAAIANSPNLVVHAAIRCTTGTTTVTPDKSVSCINGIVLGNFLDAAGDAEHNQGFNWVHAESNAAGGQDRFNFNNATGGDLNSGLQSYTGTNLLDTDWHVYDEVISVNCTSTIGANTRCAAFYIDGVKVASGLVDQNSGHNWSGTRTIALATNSFFINTEQGSQHATNFEIADLAVWTPSTAPVDTNNAPTFDITTLTSVAGALANLGANCATPGLGGLQICLTAAPGTGWLTNPGAAGNLTAGGANSLTNVAFAAATNPGEVPDRPWIRWTNWGDFHTACAETTGATGCATAANAGNRIVLGDLLCLDLNASMNTNFNVAFTTASTGWNAPANMAVTTNLGGTAMNTATFCKTATAGDVTAPGSVWAGSPTWKWTPNGADTWYSTTTWTLTDYGVYGAGLTAPSVSASQATATASGSLPCPTVSAPAGKSLFVCEVMTYDWGFIAATVGPSTTGNLKFKLKTSVSGNSPMIFWEKIGSAGSVSKSAQESGALGNPTIIRSLILN